MSEMDDRNYREEQKAQRAAEKRRNAEAAQERERRDAAWQRELEARADGKPMWLWVRQYEV